MSQKNVILNNTAQLVGIGPGQVIFEGVDTSVKYWVGGLVTVPNTMPFESEASSREKFTLAGGEGLWLAGDGLSVVYATVDPA